VFIRRSGLLVTVLLALLVPAMPSFAYEEDTHFLMTFVVCRAAGFSAADALTVAAVDQGMDDSPGTVANSGPFGIGIIPHVPEEWKWHALDVNGQMFARGVLRRKEELFDWAKTRESWQGQLIYLGVFFHYQQDTWAHRHHYDGNPTSYDAFTTYNTPFGHSIDGHQPDRPPFDPVTAMLCLEDSFKYALRFLTYTRPLQTRRFFVNTIANPPGGEKVDGNWSDPRNGTYFHQLQAAGAEGSAQKFLTDLIRTQIDAYSSGHQFWFPLYSTAEEADFEKTRAALQVVCNAAAAPMGVQIIIPSRQDKEMQGFQHLTTAQLESGMVGAP
jgi:hypothetical protein